MSTLYYDRFDSPIGPLTIAADALGLRHVLFAEHCRPAAGQALWQQTWSYRQLATHIGRPTATRAVGAANSRNPLPIILPCHRVIGSNGQLTGFAGGLAVKQALLALEAQARDY